MRVIMLKTLVITLLILSGCSARQLHDTLQAREKQECYSAPVSEQNECLKRTTETYDQYSSKRKKEIEKD